MDIQVKFPYPKACQASEHSDGDWLALREFDVFKLILNEEWTYSDFDVWLSIRDRWHYNKGQDDAHNMFKDMQRITGVRND